VRRRRKNRKHTWHPKAAQFRYLKHGKALMEKPAEVFKAYYGLTGEPRKTLRQIAEERGVSATRIQQLRREAERVLHRAEALSRFHFAQEQHNKRYSRRYNRWIRNRAKQRGWAWKEAERQGWKLS
jgi:DNA-directed RNA polymerase sigma subunit (sigma70/sigma32)